MVFDFFAGNSPNRKSQRSFPTVFYDVSAVFAINFYEFSSFLHNISIDLFHIFPYNHIVSYYILFIMIN